MCERRRRFKSAPCEAAGGDVVFVRQWWSGSRPEWLHAWSSSTARLRAVGWVHATRWPVSSRCLRAAVRGPFPEAGEADAWRRRRYERRRALVRGHFKTVATEEAPLLAVLLLWRRVLRAGEPHAGGPVGLGGVELQVRVGRR